MTLSDPSVVIVSATLIFVVALLALATFPASATPQARDHECEAEIETHDIDQMLDAIDSYRRSDGRRQIGEELADELLRGSWE